VKRWNRRVETWLLGLRTWQFLLVWDVVAVSSVLVFLMLGALIWGFNLSEISGTACGSVLAASVMAFASRDRMRIRAEQGSNASSQRHANE
jgi:uncharacterized transporter YbjL